MYIVMFVINLRFSMNMRTCNSNNYAILIFCSFLIASYNFPQFFTLTRGRTYVMITYVSKENNLGPDDKIRYIWGLQGPFLFCKAQLVRTYFLNPYQVLSFYEIKSFTRALRNTDHEVSVPKCPCKWLYSINQGQFFQINYISMG